MPSFSKEWIRPYYLKWFYSRFYPGRYPSEFADCWIYPRHGMDAGLAEWLCAGGNRPDILFLPASDWHSRTQRSQHLATELGRQGHRCFYLNPHLGREFPSPYPLSSRVAVSRLLPQIYELHVHLPHEPVYHHRSLTAVENAVVVSTLEQFLRHAKSSDPVVLVSLPLWAEAAATLKRRHGLRVIYDCHDLWEGFGRMHNDILSAEAELFRLSDTVVFSARWLMELQMGRHEALWSKAVLIPNAVRAEDFDFSYPRAGTRRKAVGYAGSLDFWFDVDAVRHAAVRHSEWDFLLLGRVEAKEIYQLRELPNVRITGEVPYVSLRQHFAAVDVCMIPFRLSPLTLATNPLKLYEYFACGHPVVSSALPEVLPFRDLVYVAHDVGEFSAQLERAMAENDPRAAQARRKFAERESWTARCGSLAPHIQPENRDIPFPCAIGC